MRLFVMGPKGHAPGDVLQENGTEEQKHAVGMNLLDDKRPTGWPSIASLQCAMGVPCVMSDEAVAKWDMYEVEIPETSKYNRSINLKAFTSLVNAGSLSEMHRSAESFWGPTTVGLEDIGHIAECVTVKACVTDQISTIRDEMLNPKPDEVGNEALDVRLKLSVSQILEAKGDQKILDQMKAELVDSTERFKQRPGDSTPLTAGMERVSLGQQQAVDLNHPSILKRAAKLGDQIKIIEGNDGHRYLGGPEIEKNWDLRIPDENRMIGQVYVSHQLMELWELTVPHSYGLWNHKSPFLWLRHVHDRRLKIDAVRRQLESLCWQLPYELEGEFSDAFDQLSEDIKDAVHKVPAPEVSWVPWLGCSSDIYRGIWAYSLTGNRYTREKWDDIRVDDSMVLEICCNGRLVYQERTYYDIIEAGVAAQHMIQKMNSVDSWFDFANPESMIGKKIWYYGEPAIVDRLILDQTCVMIKHADGKGFDIRQYHERHSTYKEDDGWGKSDWQGASEVKDSIFSRGIYPHRDDYNQK